MRFSARFEPGLVARSKVSTDAFRFFFSHSRFPTESNDFTLDFIKVANDLDADERHIFLVCGHAKPENCVGDDPHPGAPGDHPCGEADAAPEAAEKTGAFCELLSANTTTGREGEVLLYGAEPIEYLKTTHEEMKAKGETMSVPTIHLEILDADEVEKMMEEAEETEPTDEDAAGAPAPAPEPANRRHRLLRIGGGGIGGGRIGGGRIGGGIGGPGLGRGGALGGRGFGRGGMGVNQVIRGCTFAGSRCGGAGTYFNVPKVRSIHWFPYDRGGVVNADP